MPAASLRAAAGAVTFLTRVPLGRLVAVGGEDVVRGTVLFPLVGAGVGALAGAVAAALEPALPPFLAASIAVATAVVLTGALHVDALGDVFDAAGAPSRALEVMRDPRIGAFGAAAIALDLLIKVGAVAVLVEHGGVLAGLVAAGAVARAVPAPLAAFLPGSLIGGVSVPAATAALVVAAGVAVLAAGTTGAILAGVAALTTVAAFVVYRLWLGAANGDCLGAATEVTETLALVVAAGLA